MKNLLTYRLCPKQNCDPDRSLVPVLKKVYQNHDGPQFTAVDDKIWS